MAEARSLTATMDQETFHELSRELPRLLYLGDVPVEASYHGSALLYRLIEHFPPDRIAIIEAGVVASQQKRRIAGVAYHARLLPLRRLQTTRFAPWYTVACTRGAALRAGTLEGVVRACYPEAILTVAHEYSWLSAAALARRLKLPLHLVCHDEWARSGTMQVWKERVFGQVYRMATSRLCVSPFMADEYQRRYGAEGLVLYPSRAADAVAQREPPSRLGVSSTTFTCVFAGTINSRGAVRALQQLARALVPIGARLVIYGPLTPELARRCELDAPNIELGGLIPSARLMELMRERADALFVPMSFEAEHRNNMQISFPSKLTDYTAVGLPLLIYGPPYCSAARWACENPGVAEVVTEESEFALAGAVCRLARDASHRMALARAALAAGEAYFSHGAAMRVFLDVLVAGRDKKRVLESEATARA
jgi:glycosyltransferase involved in cell wall biosynthesis